MKVGKRLGAVLALAAVLLMMLPLAAGADHDGGTDAPYLAPEMNQASYWQARFSGEGLTVECQKFENHSGNIPAGYEAVVVHDGQEVRVYGPALDGLGAFTASGPFDEEKGKHKKGPHSWVMKCNIEEEPDEEPVDFDYICVPDNPGAIAQVPDGLGEFETPEDVGDACTPIEEPTTTTTTVALIETRFGSFVECREDGTFALTGDFGEGVLEIRASLVDPMFPIDPDNFDGVVLTPGDPQMTGALTGGGMFSLEAVLAEGYVLIGENPKLVTIEDCPEVSPTTVAEEEPTTTAAPVTTTTVGEDPEVLPFTGVEDFWAPIAGLLLAVGSGLVVLARHKSE